MDWRKEIVKALGAKEVNSTRSNLSSLCSVKRLGAHCSKIWLWLGELIADRCKKSIVFLTHFSLGKIVLSNLFTKKWMVIGTGLKVLEARFIYSSQPVVISSRCSAAVVKDGHG